MALISLNKVHEQPLRPAHDLLSIAARMLPEPGRPVSKAKKVEQAKTNLLSLLYHSFLIKIFSKLSQDLSKAAFNLLIFSAFLFKIISIRLELFNSAGQGDEAYQIFIYLQILPRLKSFARGQASFFSGPTSFRSYRS